MGCSLCLVGTGDPKSRRTKWHYEDETLVVLDCETCRVPMVVFRNHGPRSPAEHEYAEEIAARLGLEVTRKTWRKCAGHEHWHCDWLDAKGD